MSMEALGADHYDVFYSSPADVARAKRVYFEGVVRFFPWMATIDCFQHWLYTHPGHSREQRTKEWLRLMDRFGPRADAVDYIAFEDFRPPSMWQRQLQLFHHPFYYVEHGIPQLGALQLW